LILQALGKHCKDLQSIKLAQCESLTSQGIASLADKCQHLTRIDVESTKVRKLFWLFSQKLPLSDKIFWPVERISHYWGFIGNGLVAGTRNAMANESGA